MSSPVEEAYSAYTRATELIAAHRADIEALEAFRRIALAGAHKNGESYADIAKRTGLSRARVAQLVKS